ncbi:MAG: cobyrinate a,c-diamide synthase [Alphaproteobacteria bacterium]|nr:cobyrinate a,c-diamide synthase [Alphaproteobacteria bacterium]
MARLFISAAHKSSGKTTLTIGLCAALTARGLRVQPFKKGPDYIDPMWLGLASGGICRNLDFNTQSSAEIAAMFRRFSAGADISLVEGNKGLHDGIDVAGSDSSAALAKVVDAPVILVVDASGITRGVAPLLVGYRAFDPDVRIAGVILNKVAGVRHESKLRAAVDRYTDLPVVGAVRRSTDLEIVERHLGLVPSNEAAEARAVVGRIREAVAAQVDLDRLLDLARAASPPASAPSSVNVSRSGDRVRIGIARDPAFGFYYPDDLDAFAAAGAELVTINTLTDPQLPPDLDGLFIGGGFPETHMDALEANVSLRSSLRTSLEAGLPAYAECGGLMYLSRSVTWNGRTARMVGALPGDAVMHARPRGRGNVRLRETGRSPWPGILPGAEVTAHEFHYSGLENLNGDVAFAYDVLRGDGIDGAHDGIVVGNTVATYAHLRSVDSLPWVERFVAFVRSSRSRRHAA